MPIAPEKMPACSLRARERPRHPRRARRTPCRRAPARGCGWLQRSLALRCARWPRVRAGDGQTVPPAGVRTPVALPDLLVHVAKVVASAVEVVGGVAEVVGSAANRMAHATGGGG